MTPYYSEDVTSYTKRDLTLVKLGVGDDGDDDDDATTRAASNTNLSKSPGSGGADDDGNNYGLSIMDCDKMPTVLNAKTGSTIQK